jgi:hypothetical protein
MSNQMLRTERKLLEDSKEQDNELSYIDYTHIIDELKEFLRTDMWDFEFISYPKINFIPEMNLYKYRVDSIELIKSYETNLKSIETLLELIESRLKSEEIKLDLNDVLESYKSLEPTLIKLNFIDREDQIISKFINEWINNSKNIIIDGKLSIYNSSRIPIRNYTFHNLRPVNESGILNLSVHSKEVERILTDLSLAYDDFEIIWEPGNYRYSWEKPKN